MREISYELAKKLENFFKKELEYAKQQLKENEEACEQAEEEWWEGYINALETVQKEIKKYED